MYVHKDFYEIVKDICVFENKKSVEVTKEIADFIKSSYIKDKYGFRLFR